MYSSTDPASISNPNRPPFVEMLKRTSKQPNHNTPAPMSNATYHPRAPPAPAPAADFVPRNEIQADFRPPLYGPASSRSGVSASTGLSKKQRKRQARAAREAHVTAQSRREQFSHKDKLHADTRKLKKIALPEKTRSTALIRVTTDLRGTPLPRPSPSTTVLPQQKPKKGTPPLPLSSSSLVPSQGPSEVGAVLSLSSDGLPTNGVAGNVEPVAGQNACLAEIPEAEGSRLVRSPQMLPEPDQTQRLTLSALSDDDTSWPSSPLWDSDSETSADVQIQERSKSRFKAKTGPLPFNKKRKFEPSNLRLVDEIVPKWQGNGMPWCPSIEDLTRQEIYNDAPRRFIAEMEACRGYFQPLPHENAAREAVVLRVTKFFDREFSGVKKEVHCFGSFPTDTHLPNADMDIVVLFAAEARDSRLPLKPSGKADAQSFRRMTRLMQHHNVQLAVAGSCVPIWKAKVPIIKLRERKSQLAVDISFSNSGGVKAIATCRRWIQEEPLLPFLVRLLKLFLAMRNLSEPHCGGIGGFALTSMVFVFLKDTRAQGNIDPESNLGNTLIMLLKYWGSQIDTRRQYVDMARESLVDRDEICHAGRLVIIDPHKPSNNMAASSKMSRDILDAFSDASQMLEERLDEISKNPSAHPSVMGVLFDGNYSLIAECRQHLKVMQNQQA